MAIALDPTRWSQVNSGGAPFDRTKWPSSFGPEGNSLECSSGYLIQDDNVEVKEGIVTIKAKKEDANYSGVVETTVICKKNQ